MLQGVITSLPWHRVVEVLRNIIRIVQLILVKYLENLLAFSGIW